MKSFIVTFDTNMVDISVVHNIVTALPETIAWWHYINGTYIIMSSHTVKEIRDSIQSKWPGGRYLVVEISGYADGILPPEGWDWINKNVPK